MNMFPPDPIVIRDEILNIMIAGRDTVGASFGPSLSGC
jgi:hypothetical protein